MSIDKKDNTEHRGYQPKINNVHFGYQPSKKAHKADSSVSTQNIPTPPKGSNASDG